MVNKMKMKKKKLNELGKKRFTAIDLLICIVFISAIAYVGIRFFGFDSSNAEHEIEYKSVIILKEEQKDVFKIGDAVLSSNGGTVIGEIKEISVSPATKKTFDLSVYFENIEPFSSFIEESFEISSSSDNIEASLDNETSTSLSEEDFSSNEDNSVSIEEDKNIVNEVIIDGYVEVTVTVSAKLIYESYAYYLNGEPLKVDKDTEIVTRNYSALGKCVSIVEKKAEE